MTRKMMIATAVAAALFTGLAATDGFARGGVGGAGGGHGGGFGSGHAGGSFGGARPGGELGGIGIGRGLGRPFSAAGFATLNRMAGTHGERSHHGDRFHDRDRFRRGFGFAAPYGDSDYGPCDYNYSWSWPGYYNGCVAPYEGWSSYGW
jgi:hypothetical protein